MRAFAVKQLSIEIGKRIEGVRLLNCFSTSLNDLFLEFENWAIKVTFFHGQAYFQFPDPNKLQKKNRLPQFKELQGTKVQVGGVQAVEFDRQFFIEFSNDFLLVFHLFGRFSQIGLYQHSKALSNFPAKAKIIDEYIPISSKLPFILERLNLGLDLKKTLPFLNDNEYDHLVDNGFINANIEVRQQLLTDLSSKLSNQKAFFICKNDKEYTLANEACENTVTQLDNILDALDQYSRLYIAQRTFSETKQSHLASLRKDLQAIERKLKSNAKRIEALNNAYSYREMGDLLMANLYQIQAGLSAVELDKFDGTGKVRIKLNKQLSPQANAERYYNKAKNEKKQLEFAYKSANELKTSKALKMQEIENYEQLEDFKSLKSIAQKATEKNRQRLPYRKITFGDYELRIGKGARDNDELLRNFTSKHDLWLHAKDVSGSHVIIVNTRKKEIPASVIEYAASVAAFNSKAKNESIAAVIYTERKFVRKPKGATPGLVKVDREEVILVEPLEP